MTQQNKPKFDEQHCDDCGAPIRLSQYQLQRADALTPVARRFSVKIPCVQCGCLNKRVVVLL